jgi:VTC domain-containing protein
MKTDNHKFRYERKFAISQLGLKQVEMIVKLNPALFSKIYYQRFVNNVYLDTTYKKSFFENLNGTNNRSKYRIRWYGDLFGKINKPILEIKVKNNNLGYKKMFPLKSFVMGKNLNIQQIQNILKRSQLPKNVEGDLLSQNLSVLNRYQRKYFQSADKKFRITIDFDIKSHQLRDGYNYLSGNFYNSFEIILELKYNQQHNHLAENITKYFPFNLSKNSKYINAYQKL